MLFAESEASTVSPVSQVREALIKEVICDLNIESGGLLWAYLSFKREKKIYCSKEIYKHDFMMVASDFIGLPDIIVAQYVIFHCGS